jgi:hypothetical protein
MLRRLTVLTALTAGLSIATMLALATPALAKGPDQARITGPGLAHPIVVSGSGEPGQLSRLTLLATQTGLFTAMFGPGGSVPALARLPTPLPAAARGPRYTIVYTVPGVTPQPGQQFGRIRQDLYPRAAGGPVIYIPPGQAGFGQPLLVTGWLRARPQLTRTLSRLGVPSRLGSPAAPSAPSAGADSAHQAGSAIVGWLIAAAAVIVLAALAGTALRLRHRAPGAMAGSGPKAGARP